MGRKVNPLGFRLKINRDWDARWYAEGGRYVDLLQEDLEIRAYVKKELARAGVSRVEIERYPNQVLVKVEVNEIAKPDLDSTLVAENIAGQLERRIGHSRAIKRAIGQAMRQGGQGIKIQVSGRLAGADMARREWQSEGRIPRNTLRADIDYGTAEALTTFGRIGIKVWIYKGEVLQSQESKKNSTDQQDVYVSP
jgi:small subunit ribosomal protein S3